MRTLSILIPCYEEELAIGGLMRRLAPVVGQLSARYKVDILCIDDGSRDDTSQVIAALITEFPWISLVRHPANLGLGRAMATGVAESQGEVLAMLDADGSFPPESLPQLLDKLAEGYDIVIGSPYHPRGATQNVHPVRLFMSRSLSRLYRWMSQADVHSFSGIFRVYRREVFDVVQITDAGFSSVSDILLQALMARLRIAEVPTVLSRRVCGVSKLRFWVEVRNHAELLARTLRLRLRRAASRAENTSRDTAITRRTAEVFSQVLPLGTPDLSRQQVLLLDRLCRGSEVVRQATCLDVGCGRGEVCHALAELGAAMVVGLEPGSHVVEAHHHTASSRAHFIRGSALTLPFPRASFDFVHCSGVLHHTTDPERGFRELVRVLKPDGLLYVAVVGHEGLQLLVTLMMRLLARFVSLQRMARWLQILLPPWAVEGLLDIGFSPIRRTYSERAVRRWFEDCGLCDVRRTRSERYDYRSFWMRLWWGVGWIQLSGFKPAVGPRATRSLWSIKQARAVVPSTYGEAH